MKLYELEVHDCFGLRSSVWICARNEDHAKKQEEHLSSIIKNSKEVVLKVSGSTFDSAGDSIYTGN